MTSPLPLVWSREEKEAMSTGSHSENRVQTS